MGFFNSYISTNFRATSAILAGTTSNKLKLDFVTPENSNGIIIKPGASLTISYCEIKNAVKGITSELNLYGLNIQNVNFVNCDSVAIYITGRNRSLEKLTLTPPPPQIKYCNIINSDFGILVSNLSQIVIQQNQITGTDYGIYLSNVTTPAIINNIIYGTRAMPGIFLASCNGVVRGNQISGCTNAIHLGNSSPDIGGNFIEHNWNRGLYVGSRSLPNMRGKLVQDPIHPNLFYAVSGYNYINENGGWTIEDDGSEIFINDANAILGDVKRYGCNVIKDQRIPNAEDTPPLYNTQLLMNCRGSVHQIEVRAGGNFWDEHPIYRLEERFGHCTVYLDPILNEPCPQPDGSDGKLFITSSTGEIIDTLYAEESTVGTLTETEQLYSTAEAKFLTADFEGAELIYNQILGGNDSMEVKLDAYRRLYETGKLLGKDEACFTSLRDTYLALAGSTNDSLLVKIFDQLSSLSLVANEEYVPAIEEYDAIVQQNPNSEEAVYAEIDALTTALLVEGEDSTLQKGRLSKYLVKTSGDYNQRVDEILRKNFGSESKETEIELLPTEYTLYQNYPNPFNPITTIKYDLPNTSDVSLVIYDILGRKVKELVNTKQQAGRYEVQFNASNLASGVYIYQLIAEKYINSKKMILLK
jgi:parallel beta-helix repeat protein